MLAVMAYSGYDIEDATILNRASLDRGACTFALRWAVGNRQWAVRRICGGPPLTPPPLCLSALPTRVCSLYPSSSSSSGYGRCIVHRKYDTVLQKSGQACDAIHPAPRNDKGEVRTC